MSSCDSTWVDSNRSEEPANLDDFISGLPDSLLLDIISRLPARNAVSTTILSKRWLGLWRFTHVLNICYSDVEAVEYYMGFTGMRRFVASVSNALCLHQSPKIEKFDVSLIYLNSFSNDINAWLLIALRKNVQKLKLYLHRIPGEFDEEADEHDSDNDDDDDDERRNLQNLFGLHVLPASLFNCPSLVSLKISNCRFEHQEVINWKSLKVLLLRIMSPDNNLLADILSGCPSLESLKLCYCDNFDYIESESLQQLVIDYYNGNSERTIDTLTISAPNLRSLQISEGLTASGVSLINSSASLVNANINFSLMNKGPYLEASRVMHTKCLQEILEKLRHVKFLTIGSWCLQVLSRMEDVIAPFSNLACLTLKTPFSPYDLPGITRLLVLTPLLDSLIIEIDTYGIWPPRINGFNEEVDGSEAENGRGYWVSQEGFMQEALRSLRTVNIVGFRGSNYEMEFIAFILNNAEHLEKMIIQRRKAAGYATTNGCVDATWIAERVSSFPRCSSTTFGDLQLSLRSSRIDQLRFTQYFEFSIHLVDQLLGTSRTNKWYEPDWWKFGEGKSYFRHASGEICVTPISQALAQIISINKSILRAYAHVIDLDAQEMLP